MFKLDNTSTLFRKLHLRGVVDQNVQSRMLLGFLKRLNNSVDRIINNDCWIEFDVDVLNRCHLLAQFDCAHAFRFNAIISFVVPIPISFESRTSFPSLTLNLGGVLFLEGLHSFCFRVRSSSLCWFGLVSPPLV